MTASGSCLCGAVRLKIDGPLRPVVYCHCTQCRKQTGHFVAATAAADSDMTVDGAENVSWYAASASAKRGFCTTCGSVLFWKANGTDRTSIMAGCLDRHPPLDARCHIFCEDKGAYYVIEDGLPQFPQSD